MSLKEKISSSSKEIAGSRTKNRLTFQISYAIQLVMEFYPTDFLIMMDYIEDISIICNPFEPSEIHLYQIKTKTSDRQYLLSTIISEEWFQKLYENAQKYECFVGSAAVVCNTDVVKDSLVVFPNTKTSLEDVTIKFNIMKIRKAIAESQNVDERDVDLSKYYFIKSALSTKGHKEEVEHQFENFLLKQDSKLQILTARSIYSVIYDELDKKFNNEIAEVCTDIKEIFDKKGVYCNKIKEMISCGLAIQLPTENRLFEEYNIISVREKKEFSLQYRAIKMDMYSNMEAFVKLKNLLMGVIKEVNDGGIDDMPSILFEVYNRVVNDPLVIEPYKRECYLKMLIMVLIYRYCYGGEAE